MSRITLNPVRCRQIQTPAGGIFSDCSEVSLPIKQSRYRKLVKGVKMKLSAPSMKSFKRIAAGMFFATFLISASTAHADVTWRVLPGRSSVKFNVKHFLLSSVQGKFKRYTGTVVTKSGHDFTDAKVEASIPVSSIYTGNRDRDSHLLQEVFFHADKFPEMKFKSTSVNKLDDDKWEMNGMLTIRGVMRPIRMVVKHTKDIQMANGKMCCVFQAVGLIDRYDYGLKWNEVTETGGIAVGQQVQIVMDIALAKV